MDNALSDDGSCSGKDLANLLYGEPQQYFPTIPSVYVPGSVVVSVLITALHNEIDAAIHCKPMMHNTITRFTIDKLTPRWIWPKKHAQRDVFVLENCLQWNLYV